MTDTQTPPQSPKHAARQSYSGQRLSARHFEDVYAITGIIERDITHDASFYQSRENYAFAFSKGLKLTPSQCENIIGDVFKARFGKTMNQMRGDYIKRDEEAAQDQVLPYAEKLKTLIQDGQPFYKAQDIIASEMTHALGMTSKRSKALMKDAHQQAHGTELYDVSKELESAYQEAQGQTPKPLAKQGPKRQAKRQMHPTP